MDAKKLYDTLFAQSEMRTSLDTVEGDTMFLDIENLLPVTQRSELSFAIGDLVEVERENAFCVGFRIAMALATEVVCHE